MCVCVCVCVCVCALVCECRCFRNGDPPHKHTFSLLPSVILGVLEHRLHRVLRLAGEMDAYGDLGERAVSNDLA